MIKRILAIALLAVGVVAIPGIATAAPKNPDTHLKIHGQTYGPEDGLAVETGVIPIGAAPAPGTVTAMSTYSSWYWGTSYVSTVQSYELRYFGEAYAAANIYNGKRVIQACFQYRRSGVAVSSWICSNARSTGSSWSAGPVVNKMVYDSLNPVANPTTFHYKTYSVAPGVF